MELEVDEVGPSLRYATAKVNRTQRSGGGGGGGQGGGGQGGGGGGGQGGGWGSPGGGSGGGQGGGGGQGEDPWATGPSGSGAIVVRRTALLTFLTYQRLSTHPEPVLIG